MAQVPVSALEHDIATMTLDSETLDHLDGLVSSMEELKQAGYVLAKLTSDELEQKKRCPTCGIRRESLNLTHQLDLGRPADKLPSWQDPPHARPQEPGQERQPSAGRLTAAKRRKRQRLGLRGRN